MSQAAVIFPGQGSQAIGMGADVFESCPPARSVFERADEILGYKLSELCFEGPAEKLEQTDIQQPAIFVTSAALWAAYCASGGSIDQFAATGGLSLGEYTALYAADAISFEDGLRLVHRRGQLMQEAAEAVPSGMVSLIGADEEKASKLCDAVRGDQVLAPANFNCPGQIVISGHREACQRAAEQSGSFGCRAVALPVAGAFHSALMAPAADGLRGVLAETTIQAPSIPVLSNVSGGYHGDAQSIRQAMEAQLTHPVLWQRCVEHLAGLGVTRMVEVGPGRVLTGLTRKINRALEGINISSAAAIEAALERLASS